MRVIKVSRKDKINLGNYETTDIAVEMELEKGDHSADAFEEMDMILKAEAKEVRKSRKK
jgi:hypothetical protein